jgi:hypothetical protein
MLDLMGKYDVAPDIVTYNILLNTLSQNPNYIFKAKEILHFIEQSPTLRADAFTYNAVVKICPPEDAEMLIQVMHQLNQHLNISRLANLHQQPLSALALALGVGIQEGSHR